MPRHYIEQRSWLLGAEIAGGPVEDRLLYIDSGLAPKAAAWIRPAAESFSDFGQAKVPDHLRIDFDEVAMAALRRETAVEGFSLLRIVPRLSRYGYLSLTTVCAVDDDVPLEEIESRGVELAMRIDQQHTLLDGICTQLERLGLLEFPYQYRFGVPAVLEGSAHTRFYAFGFNQHIVLEAKTQLEPAAGVLHIDPKTRLAIDGFEVLSGWSVFVWAPAEPPPASIDRLADLVALDNVVAVQVTVLACGLSAATALLGAILRGEPGVTAASARQSCLVHRRIEQQMKLRERELLEIQKRYVAGQFGRSDYGELRESYDRAEASLLSAAEGMDAQRQQRTAALTNAILSIVAVFGVLTVFTTIVDFGYWLPMEPRPVQAGPRRISLLFFTLFVLAIVVFLVRLTLQVSEKRRRVRRRRGGVAN